MMYRFTLAAIVSIAASYVSAQVEIVDRNIPSDSAGVSQPVPAAQNTGEVYYQMQVLQQEVLQLRGMIEQQAFEIKKLKQQRLDDYLDLDRRVSQLQGKPSAAAVPSATPSASVSPPPPSRGNIAPEEELKSYKAAINLVLREHKYDQAIDALGQHLDTYPRGRYSANAQYWLGEVYLQKNELEPARQWFSRLLGEFPEHSKVPDAQFKLGKVYDLLGDKTTARKMLEQVASSNTNAARLAADYLQSNFTP